MKKKIKVVWICSFSNAKVRKHLKERVGWLERIIYRIAGRPVASGDDFGIWDTNAIEEFEKFDDVEVHTITPRRNLADTFVEFEEDGIHYHFFRDENSSLWRRIWRFLFTRHTSMFARNRKRIGELIRKINPDLVHIIGAENPQYSLGLYEVPEGIPVLLQLQALLDSIKDKVADPNMKADYTYKGLLERDLITKADYVATCAKPFIEHIRKNISTDVTILNGTLAMAQKINLESCEKQFDFVHYASSLSESKATDIAIEAFGLAYKHNPNITLDLIGGIEPDFKTHIERRIKEFGIENAVTFEGRLQTHDDVINQMRKARFALLPLKVSLVPNTLHEAMANGLPLITTVTPGTPQINEHKQCALISPQGDVADIALNMQRLLCEQGLADSLRENAAEYEHKRSNNRDICLHWVELYRACLANKHEGTPIPMEYLN